MNNCPSPPLNSEKNEKELIYENLYDWMNKLITIDNNSTVLEIGCGPDGFAPYYAKQFKKFIGIDIDDYSNSYNDIDNIQVIIYDGINIPIPNNSINIVVSHSVFEHVDDVKNMISETNRILCPGGYFYLTINPMYFSSWGSHGVMPDNETKLSPWEHLDPKSEYYLLDCPPQMIKSGKKGCYLNKLTVSELLRICGLMPWSIIRLERAYEDLIIPDFIEKDKFNIYDILNHDIRLLVQKNFIANKIEER